MQTRFRENLIGLVVFTLLVLVIFFAQHVNAL